VRQTECGLCVGRKSKSSTGLGCEKKLKYKVDRNDANGKFAMEQER
jgi:hypothetical protein